MILLRINFWDCTDIDPVIPPGELNNAFTMVAFKTKLATLGNFNDYLTLRKLLISFQSMLILREAAGLLRTSASILSLINSNLRRKYWRPLIIFVEV